MPSHSGPQGEVKGKEQLIFLHFPLASAVKGGGEWNELPSQKIVLQFVSFSEGQIYPKWAKWNTNQADFLGVLKFVLHFMPFSDPDSLQNLPSSLPLQLFFIKMKLIRNWLKISKRRKRNRLLNFREKLGRKIQTIYFNNATFPIGWKHIPASCFYLWELFCILSYKRNSLCGIYSCSFFF